jgi:hypothetical protein
MPDILFFIPIVLIILALIGGFTINGWVLIIAAVLCLFLLFNGMRR